MSHKSKRSARSPHVTDPAAVGHTVVSPDLCGLCRSDQHLAVFNEVPAWILRFPALDSETLPVPQTPLVASLWVAEPSWNNIAPSLPRALDYLQLTRAFTPMSSLEPPYAPWEPSRTHTRSPFHFVHWETEVRPQLGTIQSPAP